MMKNTALFILLFTFCGAPSLYALITKSEIFPWSSFPMYSGKETGENLFLFSCYTVDSNGKEVPIERTGILRPKYEYRDRVSAEKYWNTPLNDDIRGTLVRFSEIFRDDLVKKNLNYRALRFYFEHWERFTGPTRFRPDSRKLVYEYSLERR